MARLTPTAPLAAPEALREDHDTDGFDSGEPTLDIWLARRARANQISGASRTYVVCRERKVVGYYALASGGIDLDAAPGRLRRNMPDRFPSWCWAVSPSHAPNRGGVLVTRYFAMPH